MENTLQGLEEVEQEITEAYFYMAKQVYSGAPRVVRDEKGGRDLFLNVRTGTGNIINDVAKIPRLKVSIVRSTKGITAKRENLRNFSEVRQNFSNPIIASIAERKMVENFPNIAEEEIAEMANGAKAFEELQLLRIEAEKAQINAALQQQNRPQPPGGPSSPGRTPAEGGGLSADSAPIPPEGGIPVDNNRVNQLRS